MGRWPRAAELKIKPEAIDGNLSSTLIRPHQGRRESVEETVRGKGEMEEEEKTWTCKATEGQT